MTMRAPPRQHYSAGHNKGSRVMQPGEVPPGDVMKYVWAFGLVSTIAMGIFINVITEVGLRFFALFIAFGMVFLVAAMYLSRQKDDLTKTKTYNNPELYVKFAMPIGLAIVGTFLPPFEEMILLEDNDMLIGLEDLIVQVIIYLSVFFTIVIALRWMLRKSISKRKAARLQLKNLQEKENLSTGKYVLYRIFIVSLIHVTAMIIITNFIDDPLQRFLALLINSIANFSLIAFLKRKHGDEVFKEPRDFSRKAIRVVLRATMPFIIAFLGTFILHGAEILVYIGDKIYLSSIVLLVQVLVYGFVYVCIFLVSYVMTTD